MLFRCGILEIDPGAYRLSRHGMAVHLEPRAFELIAYLVANRDRVVSKDELIDRVWKGYPVSDSVLSGCVHKARRAVGDDPQRQELIKTIHRRGYQWVAPVEELVDSAPSPTPLTPSGSVETSSRSAWLPRFFHGKRSRLALAAGLPMLVLCAVLLISMLRSTEPRAEGRGVAEAAHQVVRIAMMPINSNTDNVNVELAALSLNDLLALRLQRQPSIVLRSREFVDELQAESTSLVDLATAAQVDYMIRGSAREIQGVPRALITMELHHFTPPATLDSTPIGSYEVPFLGSDADLAAWVRLRDAMATDIVAQLTPAIGLGVGVGTLPTDAEAFRLYLEARQRLSQLTCGQGDAAMLLLDRSLSLDPGFALAWVTKGEAYWVRAWICGRGIKFLQKALVQVERALDLDPTLPEAISGKTLALVELGKAEEAYVYISKASKLAPQTPGVHYALAYALRYAGFLQAAEREMHTAARLDPLFLHEIGEAPLAALYLHHYEDFFKFLPGPSRPYHRFYRGFAEMLRGQPQRALELLQTAYAMDPNGYYGRASACLTAVLKGDSETASEIAGEIARQRIELDTPDGEATYRVAQLLTLAGDSDEALAMLERSVKQGFFCAACFANDPVLEPLRDDPRYAATLAAAQRRHLQFGARFGLATDDSPSMVAAAQ